MKKKFMFGTAIVAICAIALLTGHKNNTIKTVVSVSNSKPNMPMIAQNVGATTKDPVMTIAKNNGLVTYDKTPPENMVRAKDEARSLGKLLADEHAIKRLNANSLTHDERLKYMAVYRRLDLLNNYIITEKYKELSAEVDKVEQNHALRLQQYGINKING